jgi:hypothetical protein
MFCPSCGMEERFSNQFCRACGSNLRIVRSILEKPDSITASAANARDEVGRAFAQKIRQTQDAVEMKIVAEDVLPQIEKFLESPEERRLRRIRVGSIISFIGLGAAIAFGVMSAIAREEEFLVATALGFVAFCIGLSFIVNGLLFTIPPKVLIDHKVEGDNQRQLDYLDPSTNELILPEASQHHFSSVIENTTQHLKEKEEAVLQRKM